MESFHKHLGFPNPLPDNSSDKTGSDTDYSGEDTSKSLKDTTKNDMEDAMKHTETGRHIFYKGVPIINIPRKSCSFLAYKALADVRCRREKCSTHFEFASLKRHINKKLIKTFAKHEQHDVVMFLMYERLRLPGREDDKATQIMESSSKQRKYLALMEILKIEQYGEKHRCDMRFLGISKRCGFLDAAAERNDIDSYIQCFMTLQHHIHSFRSGLELSLMHYTLGTCFLFMLSNVSQENTQELERKMRQFGILIDDEDDETANYHRCLQILRMAAFESFSLAREAMLSEYEQERSARTDRYFLATYYYDTPLEMIYPLLQMANARLDAPHYSRSQQRSVVTNEDIKVSETCLAEAEKLYENTRFKSKRFEGRLCLNKSGLYFRKAQLLINELDQVIHDFDVKRLNKEVITKEIEAISEALDTTSDTIRAGAKNIEGSQLEVKEHVMTFKVFVETYVTRQRKALENYRFCFLKRDIPHYIDICEESDISISTESDHDF